MDPTGDQFLASSGLAHEQDRGIRSRDPIHQIENSANRRTAPHQFLRVIHVLPFTTERAGGAKAASPRSNDGCEIQDGKSAPFTQLLRTCTVLCRVGSQHEEKCCQRASYQA